MSVGKAQKNENAQSEAAVKKPIVVARNNWSKTMADSESEDDDDDDEEDEDKSLASDDAEEADDERNEFVDDQAESADDYKSGDSMDEEEREEMRLNEIHCDGESVGSQSSSEDDDSDDDGDSVGSFIVSDNEQGGGMSDDSDDHDDHSINVGFPKKKRSTRVLESDSESEDDAADANDQMEASTAVVADAATVASAIPANAVVGNKLENVDNDVGMESGGEEAPEKELIPTEQIEANTTTEAANQNGGASGHRAMDPMGTENVQDSETGRVLSKNRFSLSGIRSLASPRLENGGESVGDATNDGRPLNAVDVPAIADVPNETATDAMTEAMDSSDGDSQNLSKLSESSANEENNNEKTNKRKQG